MPWFHRAGPSTTLDKAIWFIGGIINSFFSLVNGIFFRFFFFVKKSNIPGSEELVVYLCAFVGALIGFLWYNAFPAQVFMGDTGSLTIGGIIAVSAIIIRKELLIPILCGVFFVESLSVIIQRFYYKWGKKKGVKQRFFKRTPIHDHFRTSVAQVQKMDPGCSIKVTRPDALLHEAKITVRFWIVTIILAALTIITLKIR